MFERCVYNILGLPNLTAATQEMEQGYPNFQPAVKRSIDRMVSRKLGEYVKARKNAMAGGETDNEATLQVGTPAKYPDFLRF